MLRRGGLDLESIRYNTNVRRCWDRIPVVQPSDPPPLKDEEDLDFLNDRGSLGNREWRDLSRGIESSLKSENQDYRSVYPPCKTSIYEPEPHIFTTAADQHSEERLHPPPRAAFLARKMFESGQCSCLACAAPSNAETGYLLPPPRAAFSAEKMPSSADSRPVSRYAPWQPTSGFGRDWYPADPETSEPLISGYATTVSSR